MKHLFFSLLVLAGSFTYANSLPEGQRLAQINQMTSNMAFPNAIITVEYTRACSERLIDILTRQQVAAGKSFLEVGILVEEAGRPCQMNELPFITEAAKFRLYSELPLVLLAMDLSVDLRAPIHPGGSSVGNFSAPK